MRRNNVSEQQHAALTPCFSLFHSMDFFGCKPKNTIILQHKP